MGIHRRLTRALKRTVRIAVDARPLAHPFTGIGRYTEALLRRLVGSPGHQWFLYSDRGILPRFDYDDHVQLRTANVHPGSPFSLFYSQLVFPRWARGDCVDLFWSPRHHLPLRLPRAVPGVVTVHDLVWKRYPATMMKTNLWLERLLMGPSLRRARRVICVSEFTSRELGREYPGLSSACRVVHAAAESMAGVQERSVPVPERPFLLFVGTLEPRKNLPRLLRSFARLVRETDLPHQLVVVGAQGWSGQNLPHLIAELGIAARVELRGRLSDVELQELYQSAVALVMPSLYEGFGLPVLEAMNHATPVIASEAGALPEVVGEGGLLVDPLSEDSIYQQMLRLCADHGLRTRLSASASRQAQRFSWERAARQTLAILEEAAA